MRAKFGCRQSADRFDERDTDFESLKTFSGSGHAINSGAQS